MAAAAISIGSFAQTTVQDATNGTFPTVITGGQFELAPCSQMEASNGFENGFGNTNLTTEVGDDFVVAAGESFSVETVTMNMITGGDYPSVTVRFYEDAGGIPVSGTPLAEFVDIIPTSQDDIGDAFGRDVLAVVVDFPSPVLLESDGGDTTFWVSIHTPNGTGADSFWETTTASASTNLSAFRDGTDPTSAWAQEFVDGTGATVSMPPAAVFMIEGECEILSVEDNINDLVSIFPNPAQDVLNVRIPSDVQVQSVAMFDILGKNTGAVISNGTIDMSNLARGVYILNIDTDRGTLTEKIVKQ